MKAKARTARLNRGEKRIMNDETSTVGNINQFANSNYTICTLQTMLRQENELKHLTRYKDAQLSHRDLRKRAILVDWLLDVSKEESLHCETFHIAVSNLMNSCSGPQ